MEYGQQVHEMKLCDEGTYHHIDNAIALVNSFNRTPGARYILVDEKGRLYDLDKDFGKEDRADVE